MQVANPGFETPLCPHVSVIIVKMRQAAPSPGPSDGAHDTTNGQHSLALEIHVASETSWAPAAASFHRRSGSVSEDLPLKESRMLTQHGTCNHGYKHVRHTRSVEHSLRLSHRFDKRITVERVQRLQLDSVIEES